ncbi:MAG: GNAT family protein [Bacteroidota bacterium]
MLKVHFKTDRTIVRDFIYEDFPHIHAYAQLPQVVQYEMWGPNTEQETQHFLNQSINATYDLPRLKYELGIEGKAAQRIIGGCGITLKRAYPDTGAIGYVLHPDFWGQGIMTEVIGGLVQFGFYQLGLQSIEAACDTENIGSIKVLDRNGFQLVEEVRNHVELRGSRRSAYFFVLEKT